MEAEEPKRRTTESAHRCVKLAMELPRTPSGNPIREQLIRCGTSVASNYRAGCLAQSKESFVAKLSIVREEADESRFWFKFVIDEGLLARSRVESLMKESEELRAVFSSSRKTARSIES
jgi:four helix bundle protein